MSSPAKAPATAADFDPFAAPNRLNLGCGWDHREGFVNVDLHAAHGPDLVADVRKLGFLPASHYDLVVAQDVLEHMPRTQTLAILQHWNRLLHDGGTIMVRVPNLVALADLLKEDDYRAPVKQKEVVHFLFGTQAYTGDFHFTTFTDVLITHYLEEAGFEVKGIEPIFTWLYDVTAKKVRHFDLAEVDTEGSQRGGADDRAFVFDCYRALLGRDPDEGGMQTFLRALVTGALTRESMMREILASEEFRARLHPK
jgi:predicted SAM-dependent methyltransferase